MQILTALERIQWLSQSGNDAQLQMCLAFLVAKTVKNLPAMQETRVQSLGQENPLEKGMVTHSSILAWEISWTEESGGLQSMGSQRVRHNLATKGQQRKPVTSVAYLYAKHIGGHRRSIALFCLRKFHRRSFVNTSFTAGASYLDTADEECTKKGKAKEMTQAT